MTIDQILDDLGRREGLTYAAPPQIDQPTGPYGITLSVLAAYREAEVTVTDLQQLTAPEAREVARWHLQQLAQRHGLDQIADPSLYVQLLDFCYNSGAGLAVRWLQRTLRVPRTSVLDLATVAAANAADPFLLNQALIAARLQMIDRATDAGAIDRKYEEGLESRALQFSQLEVP